MLLKAHSSHVGPHIHVTSIDAVQGIQELAAHVGPHTHVTFIDAVLGILKLAAHVGPHFHEHCQAHSIHTSNLYNCWQHRKKLTKHTAGQLPEERHFAHAGVANRNHTPFPFPPPSPSLHAPPLHCIVIRTPVSRQTPHSSHPRPLRCMLLQMQPPRLPVAKLRSRAKGCLCLCPPLSSSHAEHCPQAHASCCLWDPAFLCPPCCSPAAAAAVADLCVAVMAGRLHAVGGDANVAAGAQTPRPLVWLGACNTPRERVSKNYATRRSTMRFEGTCVGLCGRERATEGFTIRSTGGAAVWPLVQLGARGRAGHNPHVL
eukprot:1153984-Pelagomonas_calceolata.AAC.2